MEALLCYITQELKFEGTEMEALLRYITQELKFEGTEMEALLCYITQELKFEQVTVTVRTGEHWLIVRQVIQILPYVWHVLCGFLISCLLYICYSNKGQPDFTRQSDQQQFSPKNIA
ncbi:hypothetical protein BsWGS_12570 [Bradybaena similaris]